MSASPKECVDRSRSEPRDEGRVVLAQRTGGAVSACARADTVMQTKEEPESSSDDQPPEEHHAPLAYSNSAAEAVEEGEEETPVDPSDEVRDWSLESGIAAADEPFARGDSTMAWLSEKSPKAAGRHHTNAERFDIATPAMSELSAPQDTHDDVDGVSRASADPYAAVVTPVELHEQVEHYPQIAYRKTRF